MTYILRLFSFKYIHSFINHNKMYLINNHTTTELSKQYCLKSKKRIILAIAFEERTMLTVAIFGLNHLLMFNALHGGKTNIFHYKP